MTGRERMLRALTRKPVEGRVPHFELVFFLTMEAFGKVHPSHRYYSQWNQMSQREKSLQIDDMADIYIMTAQRYGHDAIFVHPNPGDMENTTRLLERIREKSGNEYYLMMHGDPTLGIPDGEHMMEFAVHMYEKPEILHEQSKNALESCLRHASLLQGKGLLDGYALCSDYAFNVNPFFSPEQFAEFVFPYLKTVICEYRRMGFYTIKHTDGNIMPILNQIVDAEPDALHSIDPQGGMNLAYVRRIYGDKVATIGNVNCGLLQTGTDSQVDEDVRRCLHEGMDDGKNGYIFSTSNCIYTGLPLSRYERILRILEKEGIYEKRHLYCNR